MHDGETEVGSSYHKCCRKCNISFFYGYNIVSGVQQPHSNRHLAKFWLSTSKTAYETRNLDSASSSVFIHKAAFLGLEQQYAEPNFWGMTEKNLTEILDELVMDEDLSNESRASNNDNRHETFCQMYETRKGPSRFKLQHAFFQYATHCIVYEMLGNVNILSCPISHVYTLNKYCDYLFPKLRTKFDVVFCHDHLKDTKICNYSHSKVIVVDGHMKIRHQV